MKQMMYEPLRTVPSSGSHQLIYAKPVIHEPIYMPSTPNATVQRYRAAYQVPPITNHFSTVEGNDPRLNNQRYQGQRYHPYFGEENVQNEFQVPHFNKEHFESNINYTNYQRVNYPIQPNLFQPTSIPAQAPNGYQHPNNSVNLSEQSIQQSYPSQASTQPINPNVTVDVPKQAGQAAEGYFANPLYNHMNLQHPMYNPYPKMKILPKNQTPGTSLLSSFKGTDGNFDLVSVVNTCGQMVNVVNQVSGIFKGLGGMFKI